ncbi:uncharacterized protein AMSG_00430 [Thecamonas trahens ATCC 50062]|uniref:PAS domain-containing protein n=1 Tax=Thecamonas trahens ATCC 50062 TaxID=461836 RepID=A0A0L0DBI1_THETB|nr:hypothetical protein AMSG_00430 [Thecamonas trahens ATCC 50062]KNC48653.1 hypothetical protein AMSG_00430 [Thecamonas trahens ATCC 50062]|eukprot:XP_013762709.1 hypothetical protein AMSG_00430 [Thecamonas trahens ATCC 50062]
MDAEAGMGMDAEVGMDMDAVLPGVEAVASGTSSSSSSLGGEAGDSAAGLDANAESADEGETVARRLQKSFSNPNLIHDRPLGLRRFGSYASIGSDGGEAVDDEPPDHVLTTAVVRTVLVAPFASLGTMLPHHFRRAEYLAGLLLVMLLFLLIAVLVGLRTDELDSWSPSNIYLVVAAGIYVLLYFAARTPHYYLAGIIAVVLATATFFVAVAMADDSAFSAEFFLARLSALYVVHILGSVIMSLPLFGGLAVLTSIALAVLPAILDFTWIDVLVPLLVTVTLYAVLCANWYIAREDIKQIQSAGTRYGNLIGASFEGIIIAVPWTIHTVNPAAADLLGCTEADLVGSNFIDLADESMNAEVTLALKHPLGLPTHAVFRVANGKRVLFELLVKPYSLAGEGEALAIALRSVRFRMTDDVGLVVPHPTAANINPIADPHPPVRPTA